MPRSTRVRRKPIWEPIWCLLTWDPERYEHGRDVDGRARQRPLPQVDQKLTKRSGAPGPSASRPQNPSLAGPSDGASRTRTGDLLGAIQALSQLSYSPVSARLSSAPRPTSVVVEHGTRAQVWFVAAMG